VFLEVDDVADKLFAFWERIGSLAVGGHPKHRLLM
jgi:hypothetical protein